MVIVLLVVIGLVLIACAGIMALRLLPAGLDGIKPFPYAIALIPLLWVPILGCTLISCAVTLYAFAQLHTLSQMQLPSQVQSLSQMQSLLPQDTFLPLHTIIGYSSNGITSVNAALSSIITIAGVTCGISCVLLGVWAWMCMHNRLTRAQVITRLVAAYTASRSSLPNTVSLHTLCRVMTLNCRFGRANAQSIIECIHEHNVHILALQEVTADLYHRLLVAGIHNVLPYELSGMQRFSDNGGYNMLFSAYPLTQQRTHSLDIDAAAVPSAMIAIPHNIVSREKQDQPDLLYLRIASVHPKSPMRGTHSWSEGIRGIAQFVNPQRYAHAVHSQVQATHTQPSHAQATHTQPSHERLPHPQISGIQHTYLATPNPIATVVMGDCNSNTYHPSFHSLLAQGFADSCTCDLTDEFTHMADTSTHPPYRPSLFTKLRIGTPLMTFPRWLPWPRMELDHVLIYQPIHNAVYKATHTTTHETAPIVIAHRAHAYTIVDSDHCAVIADITAVM